MTGSGITCWWSYGVWKMGRTSSTWPPCPWIIICTKYGRLGEKNKNRKCQLFEKLQFFILFIFFIQKSVEIGNDLPGLKLKTLHVGGLPGEGNHVRKGFIGCIQVSVFVDRTVGALFFFLSSQPSTLVCCPSGRPYGRDVQQRSQREHGSGPEDPRGGRLRRGRPVRLQHLSWQQPLQRRLELVHLRLWPRWPSRWPALVAV